MIQGLRPYQKEGLRHIAEAMRAGTNRLIRVAPTGSGKTVEMTAIVLDAAKKGLSVLILTHRLEIFQSTLKSLKNIDIQEINQETKNIFSDRKIFIGMVETVWRRLEKIPKPDVLIIDECHFNNFTKVLEKFTEAVVIGFTATPIGKHLVKHYQTIIDNVSITDLIEQKYLATGVPYMMVDVSEADIKSLPKSGKDFDEGKMFELFNKKNIYEGVVRELNRMCEGRKGIIFCSNINHVIETHKEISKAFPMRTVELVHSYLTKEKRTLAFSNFENSKDGILVNAGIATTGYNHPPISFALVLRATTSLPLWLQMQGRASRIHEGKKDFIVLDFGRNHERLGRWDSDRSWELKERKKKNEGAAPIKHCKRCFAILPASANICTYCGYEIPKTEKEIKEGILIEVEKRVLNAKGKRVSELTIDELISLQINKTYSAGFIWRIVRSRGLLSEYAMKMRYSEGWVYRQMREPKGFINVQIK